MLEDELYHIIGVVRLEAVDKGAGDVCLPIDSQEKYKTIKHYIKSKHCLIYKHTEQ